MIETPPTGIYQPQPMRQMMVTPEEMNNIASQLPLEIMMSHAAWYDRLEQTLHYAKTIADLIERADKTLHRARVPLSISPLQAHLEMAARGVSIAEALAAIPAQDRIVVDIIWQRAPVLNRSDQHVVALIKAAGLDADEFFIAAARRRS